MIKNKWVWTMRGMGACLSLMSAAEAMLGGSEKDNVDPGQMPAGRSAQKLGHSEVYLYVPQRRAAAHATAVLAGQRGEPAQESTSEKGPLQRKPAQKSLSGRPSALARKRPVALSDDDEDYLSPSPASSPSPSAATDEDYLTPSSPEKESTASEAESEEPTPPRRPRVVPPPRKRARTAAPVTTSVTAQYIAPPLEFEPQLLQLSPAQRTQLCHHLLNDQGNPMQLSVDQLRRQVQGLPQEDREALWSSFPDMTTPLGQFAEFVQAPENGGARLQLLRKAIESIHSWRANETTLSLRSRNYRKSELSRVGMALVYEALMSPFEQREQRWDWGDFFGRHPFADVLGNQVTDSQTTITLTGAALVQVISQQCVRGWKAQLELKVGSRLKSLNIFKLLGQSMRHDEINIPAMFAEALFSRGWQVEAIEAIAPGLSAHVREEGAQTKPIQSGATVPLLPPPPPLPALPISQPQYVPEPSMPSNVQPQYAPPPPPPFLYLPLPPYVMPPAPAPAQYNTSSTQAYGPGIADQVRYAAVPYPLTTPATPSATGGFGGWDTL